MATFVGFFFRANFCWILCWRLRSTVERDQLLGELNALLDKKVLMQMYLPATSEKRSFWYINLAASNVSDMFWKNFEMRMIPSGASPNAVQE